MVSLLQAVLEYMQKYAAQKEGAAKKSKKRGAVFKFAMLLLGLFKRNRKKQVTWNLKLIA